MSKSWSERSVQGVFTVLIFGFLLISLRDGSSWVLFFSIYVSFFLIPGLKNRGDKFFWVKRPQHVEQVALHGNVNQHLTEGWKEEETERDKAYNDYSSKRTNRAYSHPSNQGLFPVKQGSVQQDRQKERMERIHSFPISSLFSHCPLFNAPVESN